MGGTGLELPQELPGKPIISQSRGAESGAVGARDPDLARLIAAWPTLPEPIRRAILALVGSQ